MGKSSFQKFQNKEEKGAKLKERIRQEKKKVRQETKEYFAQQKAKRTPVQLVTKAGAPQPAKPGLKVQTSKTGAAGQPETAAKEVKQSNEMPLNKYIAHAGICSRRDAADVVKSGKVSVNGKVITEPGYKVTGSDEIKVQGKKISAAKSLVYILLNKPKDHITTTEDPEGRKTVMDIVKKATTERVYPVGRLDRNTTGVLLLTNDGELAQKLSHPSYEVKKNIRGHTRQTSS